MLQRFTIPPLQKSHPTLYFKTFYLKFSFKVYKLILQILLHISVLYFIKSTKHSSTQMLSSGIIIFCSVSENQSILVMPPWRNWSLLTAITASMLLHFLILYAPFMKVWFCRMFFLFAKLYRHSNWPFATVHTAV